MFKGRAPVWANKAREDDPQQYIWLFDIKEQPVCPRGGQPFCVIHIVVK